MSISIQLLIGKLWMYIFHSSMNVDNSVSFTPQDIQALVQGLPKKKATGPDSISMEHLMEENYGS